MNQLAIRCLLVSLVSGKNEYDQDVKRMLGQVRDILSLVRSKYPNLAVISVENVEDGMDGLPNKGPVMMVPPIITMVLAIITPRNKQKMRGFVRKLRSGELIGVGTDVFVAAYSSSADTVEMGVIHEILEISGESCLFSEPAETKVFADCIVEFLDALSARVLEEK